MLVIMVCRYLDDLKQVFIKMIRLFIAIDLPREIKQELELLCSFGLKGVKWVETSQFHLSLKFIGEVPYNVFEDVADSLAKIKAKPFLLTLAEVGTFPGSKTPRVIWAGVEKNTELFHLQKKVETQLSWQKLKGDKRKYSPHITLARVKSNNPGRIGDFLVQNNLYKSKPFEVDRFFLFSSVLTPKGAVYRKEREYLLI